MENRRKLWENKLLKMIANGFAINTTRKTYLKGNSSEYQDGFAKKMETVVWLEIS
jgi:hypothetical protein